MCDAASGLSDSAIAGLVVAIVVVAAIIVVVVVLVIFIRRRRRLYRPENIFFLNNVNFNLL